MTEIMENLYAYVVDKYTTGHRPGDIQRIIDALPSGNKTITTICDSSRIRMLPKQCRDVVNSIECDFTTHNIITVEFI